jgi:hypothetical protein
VSVMVSTLTVWHVVRAAHRGRPLFGAQRQAAVRATHTESLAPGTSGLRSNQP